ncbi:Drug/Metabolite Transporter (DMT) Superfamily [Thraustotheca clavata]|uniref:Drug/Metabolite Transporter (DMT) Superfamily n=1 Tax=Thraustotheca clavata TaxID=74557 RepID=A0A1W0AA41_9STRA|nr:Drug/Metabolite Transporter (DMT) Superfamily [Thraustotheca clavata]
MMKFDKNGLVFSLGCLIASRCVDRVLYTRITYAYGPFLWYFSNIILPIAFMVTSWPIVWYKMWFTEEITPEMRRFPHYKFALMGFFDTAYNLLGAFPTPHIGGNFANVLDQLNLPFNMILSVFFLNTNYKRCHILGAILVLYGGLVNMIPLFTGGDTLNMPDPSVFWILLYISALIPAAASNVYKEIGLKDVDLDIWYANAWISFYQVALGIMTIWTIRIPALSDPPVPWSDFGHYVGIAHECFLGNPVEFNGKALSCNDGIFTTFLWFILFNMTYNQLMLYIFKEGSSVLFVVSSAVCLPMTDILYMFPFISGAKAHQSFTIYDGFALFVLVIGLLVYHSEKETRKSSGGTRSIEKSPMLTSPRLQRTHLMKSQRGRLVYRQSPLFPGKSPIARKSNSPASYGTLNPSRPLRSPEGSNSKRNKGKKAAESIV